MSTLGERIKQIRTNNHLTQQQFAEKISVSRPFISRIEADKETPSDSLIKLICEVFSIERIWLIKGTGKMEHNRYTDYFLSFVANENILETITGNPDLESKNIAANILASLVTMLQNKNIKENSEYYYQSKIMDAISMMGTYINSSLLIQDIDPTKWFEEKRYLDKTMKEIQQKMISCLDDAALALFEENLNEQVE